MNRDNIRHKKQIATTVATAWNKWNNQMFIEQKLNWSIWQYWCKVKWMYIQSPRSWWMMITNAEAVFCAMFIEKNQTIIITIIDLLKINYSINIIIPFISENGRRFLKLQLYTHLDSLQITRNFFAFFLHTAESMVARLRYAAIIKLRIPRKYDFPEFTWFISYMKSYAFSTIILKWSKRCIWRNFHLVIPLMSVRGYETSQVSS